MDGQNFNQNQNYNNGGSNNNYQDNTSAQNTYYGQPEIQDNASQNGSNSLAIVSLVTGILSIVSCCCGIGFIFSIPGIICGVMSNKKGSSGMATAGIICSIVGIVFSAIMIIYYVAIFASGAYTDLYSNYYYY